jgi:signal transduction histidine kinase
MTRELAMAEERERDRIAGELHDHVGQRLILGKMRLDSLASRLPSDQFENDVDEISTLIDHSIQDIRSLTFQLRPPILASAGLEAAVQWLGEEFKKDFGLQIDFKDDNEPKPMQYEVRSTVFQVVRELLLNVAKHAGTKHVAVRMKRDNGNIVINIDDEGIGFDISEVSKRKVKDGGFGLFSINQRIDFLGGSLSIDTNSGNGTQTTIIVPLKE